MISTYAGSTNTSGFLGNKKVFDLFIYFVCGEKLWRICRVCVWQHTNRAFLYASQSHLPFAVVGSTEEVKIGNKMVKARQYPWGTVQGKPGLHPAQEMRACSFSSQLL